MRTFFLVRHDWEIENPILSVLYGYPDAHVSPVVQLSINGNLFLVDTVIEAEEGLTVINRYILGSVLDAVYLLNQAVIKKGTISLLPARLENTGSYEVSELIKVIAAKYRDSGTFHILCCANGKRYTDSLISLVEEDLVDCKTIYFQKENE